jgi:hypothetical protein
MLCRMGFDDLAKSMKSRHGRDPKGGTIDVGADPEAVIAHSRRAQQRSEAIKDFIQAGIMIPFGIAIALLMIRGDPGSISVWEIGGFGIVVLGIVRITQGVALLRAKPLGR